MSNLTVMELLMRLTTSTKVGGVVYRGMFSCQIWQLFFLVQHLLPFLAPFSIHVRTTLVPFLAVIGLKYFWQ